MNFDPAQFAAQLAAATARCDGQQFEIDFGPTNIDWIPGARFAVHFRPRLAAGMQLVQWKGVYKGRALAEQFACDLDALGAAKVAACESAQMTFDLVDLQQTVAGVPNPPSSGVT
jgi:hypothetical protein